MALCYDESAETIPSSYITFAQQITNSSYGYTVNSFVAVELISVLGCVAVLAWFAVRPTCILSGSFADFLFAISNLSFSMLTLPLSIHCVSILFVLSFNCSVSREREVTFHILQLLSRHILLLVCCSLVSFRKSFCFPLEFCFSLFASAAPLRNLCQLCLSQSTFCSATKEEVKKEGIPKEYVNIVIITRMLTKLPRAVLRLVALLLV